MLQKLYTDGVKKGIFKRWFIAFEIITVVFAISIEQLILRKVTVTTCVKRIEYLFKLGLFAHTHEVLDKVAKCSLLDLVF